MVSIGGRGHTSELLNYETIVEITKSHNIAYINAMVNISIDCDCDENASAPCMKNIGILASTDPVAIDQACLDIIYNSNDLGKENLIQRIEEKKAIYIIETAEKLGTGSREYELINID